MAGQWKHTVPQLNFKPATLEPFSLTMFILRNEPPGLKRAAEYLKICLQHSDVNVILNLDVILNVLRMQTRIVINVFSKRLYTNKKTLVLIPCGAVRPALCK